MKQKKLFALLSCFIISLTILGIYNADIPQDSPIIPFLKTSADPMEPNQDPFSGWPIDNSTDYFGNNCSDEDWYRINANFFNMSVIVEIMFNHSEGNLDLAIFKEEPALTMKLLDNSTKSNSTFHFEKVGVYVNTPIMLYVLVNYTDTPNENYTLNVSYIPGNVFQDSIKITNPKSLDNWSTETPGTMITWDSNGTFPFVEIILLNSFENPIWPIATPTSNDGSFEWFIPYNISSGSYYISIRDPGRPFINDTSDLFNITNCGPTIQIQSPATGINWINGSSHEIQWSNSGNLSGNVEIELLNTNHSFLSTIKASTENNGSYMWAINQSSGNYHIRVKYNATLYGDSDLFTISSSGGPIDSIYVSDPHNGDNWINGTWHWINWTTIGPTNNVNISLLNNLFTIEWSIADWYTNSPSEFYWKVYDVPTGIYHIKVVNSTDGAIFDISDPFNITNTPPGQFIDITKPSGFEVWLNGSTVELIWTSSWDFPNVLIELWNASSNSYLFPLSSSTTNDGSFQWTIPTSTPTGSYYIYMQNTANTSIFDFSNTFTISSSSGPTGDFIEVTSPVDDDVWVQNSTYEITWVYSGSFTMVSIELWNESGYIMDIAINTTNTGSLIWTIPENVYAGDYHIRIYDSLNHSIIGKSKDFRIGKKLVPGFPLLIIFGVSIVAIVSIIRKQSNKRKMNL